MVIVILILLAIFAGYYFLNVFSHKNISLDSQIAWVFKMYSQEKSDPANQSKSESELLQITGKRYLATVGKSYRSDLIENNTFDNIKQLTVMLIDLDRSDITKPDWKISLLSSKDVMSHTPEEIEAYVLWKKLEDRVDTVYKQYYSA
jgi:hypothetical protein